MKGVEFFFLALGLCFIFLWLFGAFIGAFRPFEESDEY